MFLAYYDESGDDGYPATSTDLFVLACIYMRHDRWRANFERVQDLRRTLAKSHGFRFDWELHTRELLLDKDPYRSMRFQPSQRMELVTAFCRVLATHEARVITVVINKRNIVKPDYNVLDTALTYSVQRVHNDLQADSGHFLVITDEGRVAKMRSTVRRLQKINYVPASGGGESYRQDLKNLIEDPLPKNSQDSYFIQLADMVAAIVSLWCVSWQKVGAIPNRMNYLPLEQPRLWLDMLKPVLNLQASPRNPYGVVCYPKQAVTP